MGAANDVRLKAFEMALDALTKNTDAADACLLLMRARDMVDGALDGVDAVMEDRE